MLASEGEPRLLRLMSLLVLLLGGCVSIALVYSYTLQTPSILKFNQWAFFEWLINFEGGFVRRGLAGHIIRQNVSVSEIEVVNLIVFVQFLLFVTLSIVFASVFVAGFTPTLVFVLCPLSFLGMAIGNHYYFRKEIIFYIGILLAAVLLELFRRCPSALVRGAMVACIGLWTAIGPFVHEGFIFFCVPIFSLIVAELVGDRGRPAAVVSYLLLSVLMFGVMAYFSGNESIASQIWLSLSDQARSLAKGAEAAGGISAIGWSTRYAVSLTVNAVLSGMAAYYLLSLLVVYLVVGAIVSAQRRLSMVTVVTSPPLIVGFGLIVLSFVPLFMVAWDWGRVICGVYVVALAFFSLRFDAVVVAKVGPWLSMVAKPVVLTVAGLLFLSLFKVPECCIRAIDGNQDLLAVIRQVRQLFH